MLNQKEHDKKINAAKHHAHPSKYKRTLFGNFKPDTVRQMVVDALEDYRQAELDKMQRNTSRGKRDA
jgi:hypothetical protein